MNKLVMKRKAKKAADYFFTYLLLIVIAIICAGPFIWLLLSSLRTGANIYNLHFSISEQNQMYGFNIGNFILVNTFTALAPSMVAASQSS